MSPPPAPMVAPETPAQAIAPAPAPIARPALSRWMFERGIDLRSAGAALGKSHEWVRTICLPFGDPRRVEPDAAAREAIAEWTAGAVRPESFSAPAETVERSA